jgi:hypothetical protein
MGDDVGFASGGVRCEKWAVRVESHSFNLLEGAAGRLTTAVHIHQFRQQLRGMGRTKLLSRLS